MTQAGNTISIKGITWRYLSLILFFALAGLVLTTVIGVSSSNQDAIRHEAFEGKVLSHDISDLVSFYRNIADALAKRQEVVDILNFADVERAVLWAREVRELLPESIGVALIDPDGKVLGEPLQLNLGKQCVADLNKMLVGRPVAQPPVHDEIAALRHFDVISPVRDGGAQIGLLFMSFSLDVLQQRVEQRVSNNQYLLIEDVSGRAIATAGDMQGMVHSGHEHVRVEIPATDWRMHYMSGDESINRQIVFAVAFGGGILIVVVALALFFSTRLVRFFTQDLLLIHEMLSGVHAGQGAATVKRPPTLQETTDILQDVSALVWEIEEANALLKQQSRQDGLTGLLNRRAFDELLLHHVELAARGECASLVMLDLDLFKQVNDRYGHGVGDEVLRALADSLRERCRSIDIIARLGGDEFALLLHGELAGGLEAWFRDVDKLFGEKQSLINGGKGVEPACRISAGAVVVEAGQDMKQLLELADSRLYEAKRAGRATFRFE